MKTAAARRPARQPPLAAAPTGPRLRLEPLDLESQTLLRVSARLAEPAGDETRRATAAMLWQAINADPQEVLRTTVMLQNLERDLAQLRLNSSQTRAEMAALRQRLDAAQPWYGSAAALQLIALVLLVAAATAAVLWYRTRRSELEHWYAQPPDLSAESALAADAAADAAVAEQAGQAPVQPSNPVPVVTATAPGAQDVPAPVFMASPREAAAPQAPRAAADGPIDFDVPMVPATAPAQRRSTDGVMRVETLAATFEEVEFLSSLGLTVDAADVLKSYLQDSGSPAPIAFYELMRLYEHVEDRARADALRRRYSQVFGLEAPRLDQVTTPVGLESMAALSARITSAWHTPQVLQVIEDALFGTPLPGMPLTLQAGRDLLCLHDVAMNLVTEASSMPGAGDGHALAPWAHAEDAAGARMAVHAATDVHDGGALGVDIDVGAAGVDPLPPLNADTGEAEPALRDPDVAPLIAEMQAAAREAEERAAARRRREEEEDAFSAVMASERMPFGRH